MQVYAVIGGADYEGENFSSLRLFDCRSAADSYAAELKKEIGIDYVEVEKREICMGSAQ